MSSRSLQDELCVSSLSGGNMAYIDSLYEDFLADPLSVSFSLLCGWKYPFPVGL